MAKSLNRTAAEWAAVVPDAFLDGSIQQARNIIAMMQQDIAKLNIFVNQVAKAAGSLEGLPDGHAFEMVWITDDSEDVEVEGRPGIITVGMIRRVSGGADDDR